MLVFFFSSSLNNETSYLTCYKKDSVKVYRDRRTVFKKNSSSWIRPVAKKLPLVRKNFTSWRNFGWRPSVQFSSVAQSGPTLCKTLNCSTQAFLSITNSRNLLKLMSIKSVIPSNHLILCPPLLLLPPIPSSIRVFSNESALCIRWPKYWSFSFSISPSSEHPGLISFRMD